MRGGRREGGTVRRKLRGKEENQWYGSRDGRMEEVKWNDSNREENSGREEESYVITDTNLRVSWIPRSLNLKISKLNHKKKKKN